MANSGCGGCGGREKSSGSLPSWSPARARALGTRHCCPPTLSCALHHTSPTHSRQVSSLTCPPSLLGSPEKEAFKKRAKLQQENSEETDENEAEEVRTLATPPPMLPPCPYWGGSPP